MKSLETRLARLERRPGPAETWRVCSFWREQPDGLTFLNHATGETATMAELELRIENVVTERVIPVRSGAPPGWNDDGAA